MHKKFLTRKMKSYIRALLQDKLVESCDVSHELLLITDVLGAVDAMESWLGTPLPANRHLRRRLAEREEILRRYKYIHPA